MSSVTTIISRVFWVFATLIDRPHTDKESTTQMDVYRKVYFLLSNAHWITISNRKRCTRWQRSCLSSLDYFSRRGQIECPKRKDWALAGECEFWFPYLKSTRRRMPNCRDVCDPYAWAELELHWRDTAPRSADPQSSDCHSRLARENAENLFAKNVSRGLSRMFHHLKRQIHRRRERTIARSRLT